MPRQVFVEHLGGMLGYPNELPLTAVQFVNNDVLPAFEAKGATIDGVPPDNVREFCGREDRHPYELYLQFAGIEQKRTQSQTSAVQRHRQAPASHTARRAFRFEGRKTWFETTEEMQAVLYQVGRMNGRYRFCRRDQKGGRTIAEADQEGA
jgi:hypothetical protein